MTTRSLPQADPIQPTTPPPNAAYRVTVPSNLYFDVIAPAGISEEEVRRMAVEQLILLRAQDGYDVIESYSMRVYPKDDFTTTDISVEWSEELAKQSPANTKA